MTSNIGRWAISYLHPMGRGYDPRLSAMQIETETSKMYRCGREGRLQFYGSQMNKGDVLLLVDTKEQAEVLLNAANGIYGEMHRRKREAESAAYKAISALIAKATGAA